MTLIVENQLNLIDFFCDIQTFQFSTSITS
jgi:hypothetical protein